MGERDSAIAQNHSTLWYYKILQTQHGRLVQLVERLPYKQDVTGSSPVSPI